MINGYTLGGDREVVLAAAQRIFATTPGAMWLPDQPFMFQISDGTTASAVNSPVGYIADQSGGNRPAIQADSAKRVTFLRTPQTGRNIFVPSGTQVLTATLPNWGSCTVLRPRPDGTIDSTTETVSGAYNITELNRVFCGCVIVQNTLTSDQQYALRQLFGWYRPGLGVEIFTNTALLTETGWTKIALGTPANLSDITIGSGAIAVMTTVAASTGVSTRFVNKAGKILNLSYFASNRSGVSQPAYIRTGSSGTNSAGTDVVTFAVPKQNGKNSFAIIPPYGEEYIKLFTSQSVGQSFTLFNPSLKEII